MVACNHRNHEDGMNDDVQPRTRTVRDEQWHVESLFVQDKWRRKGVATRLMEMIMGRAVVENVPVTLYASEEGQKLYIKLGFAVLGATEGTDGDGLFMMWMSGK